MGQATCLSKIYTGLFSVSLSCVLMHLIIPHIELWHACLATNNAVLCITKTLRHQHGKGNRPHCDNRSIRVYRDNLSETHTENRWELPKFLNCQGLWFLPANTPSYFYLPRISFGSYWDWNPAPSADTLSSRRIIASKPSEGTCLNPGYGTSPSDDVEVDRLVALESAIDTIESRFPEYRFISWSVRYRARYVRDAARLGRLAHALAVH